MNLFTVTNSRSYGSQSQGDIMLTPPESSKWARIAALIFRFLLSLAPIVLKKREGDKAIYKLTNVPKLDEILKFGPSDQVESKEMLRHEDDPNVRARKRAAITPATQTSVSMSGTSVALASVITLVTFLFNLLTQKNGILEWLNSFFIGS